MKVKIDETVEMSDDQRRQLADILDEKQSRRKATREEAKVFVWSDGRAWDIALDIEWKEMFDPTDETDDMQVSLQELL